MLSRMPYAFRIGPLDASDGTLFLYAARASTGQVEASQADDDVTGLRTLSEVLGGEPLVVEPCLAKAAAKLGLRSAPLPADVAHEKATMALGLVLGMDELIGRDVSPSLIADLLDAAIAFSTAAPWRFVDGDTPLRVEVIEGKRRRTLDGTVMGQAQLEFGVVLYLERGLLQRLLAHAAPERMAVRSEILAVSLEPEPGWAAAAIEQALGKRVVPVPMHIKGKRPRKLDAHEMATLSALLRAASELGPSNRRARSTSGVEPRVEVVIDVPEPLEEAPPPASPRGPTPSPTPKVGRNAPCPCGSGRKHKRCCLGKDEAAARAQASPSRRDALRPIVQLVLEIVAFTDDRFPGWRGALPSGWQALEALPKSDQLRMPLLAYQGPLEPGTTPAMAWARARATALDPTRAEIFAAEQQALLSVWEVLEVRAEVGMLMVDLLTGEQRFVHEVSGSRGLTPRAAVLARVTTVRARSELSGIHPHPLPPAAALEVVTAVRRRLGLKVAAVPPGRLGSASTVDALLDEWQAAHARQAAARPVERTVQNTDGEPFEPHEDRFVLASGTTRKQVAAAVQALPGAHLDEDGRRTTIVTLTKPGNAVHPHWARTVIGTVTIDDRQLVLESNSRVRIDMLRATLERELGPRVEHRGRTQRPAMKAPAGAGEGPVMMDAMASVGLWHKPVELVVREEARNLLDQPSTVLGGLTPRAAVTKASSRRALHQWLKELEHGEARSEVPGISAFVREALELSAVGELAPADEHTRRTGRGRKVSETLLDFAAPLFEDLRDPTAIRPMLEFAALVWNVEVLRQSKVGRDTARAMNALLERAGLHEAEEWLEWLRARRRHFAEDERLIEVLEVRWDDGNIYVKALARLAEPRAKAPRKPPKPKKQLGLFE